MEPTRATYRILSGEREWYLVRGFFERLGFRQDIIPSHNFARCVVAEYEGKVIAAWFMQVAIHFEPLVIDPEHAGRVYLRSFVGKVDEALATSVFRSLPAFAFIDTEHTEKVAVATGFHKLESSSIYCRPGAYVSGNDMRESCETREAVNAGIV
jgi:hypothetical protein